MQPLQITNGIPSALVCTDDDDDGRRTSSPSQVRQVTKMRHGNNNNSTAINMTMPVDSPRSFFDSNELFEDVLDETYGDDGVGRINNNNRITDDDLERLMGIHDNQRNIHSTTTTPSSSFIMQQYCRVRSWLCPCCNNRRKQQQRRNNNNNNNKLGNMILLFPYCVAKFNCGILGPHWFGPVACLLLLSGATSRLVHRSYGTIGPVTARTCLAFYFVSVLFLSLVVCRDPGVVRSITATTTTMEEEEEQIIAVEEEEEEEEERCADDIVAAGHSIELGAGGRGRGALSGRASGSSRGSRSNTNVNQRSGGGGGGWRYCDLCSVYQPPGAVHCPDCNVCIRGFDHHCPWMGTCIGEKNYTLFLAFNFTWLIYLFYAIVWVLNVGAQLYRGLHATSAIPSNDDDEI